MLGSTNAQSGGQSGATLTVTAPAGAYVTVTDGDTTKARTVSSSGQVTFKGLATGAWRVTISREGESPVTKTVTVTADYEAEIAFFTATIAVSYPAGSICTCTGAGSTQTAPTQTGSHTFVVGEAGNYTVTAVQGTDRDSKTVSVTTDGQRASVTLSFNAIPKFTYTGDYEIVSDADEPITTSKENWKVRFLTSGTLTMQEEKTVDVFLVGGGGSAGTDYGGGGGSGYTKTARGVRVTAGVYEITVGSGGAAQTAGNANGNDGGASMAFGVTANGGQHGFYQPNGSGQCGGNGGSGGAGLGGNPYGGTDGADGNPTSGRKGGTGQHTTTREFGEANARLYAGGGNGEGQTNPNAGGGGAWGLPGSPNTGGGSGSGGAGVAGRSHEGGSGIVIIRNARGG